MNGRKPHIMTFDDIQECPMALRNHVVARAHLKDVTPVWYVMQGIDIVAIIQLEIADTWAYRQEAKNYPDCRVWCHVMFGWAYMETNSIRSSIWKPAIPPEVLLMVKLLEI